MIGIERLARIVHAQNYHPDEEKRLMDEHWPESKDKCYRIARAVLKALETPTPEMIEAGRSIAFRTKFKSYDDQAETIFRTMIRAAQEQGDG